MDIEKHFHVFDMIAPIYGWFFSYQVRTFRRILAANSICFREKNCRILDIGCGTGALVSVLAELGHDVTGVDGSARMVSVARRMNQGNTVKFQTGNALTLFNHHSDADCNHDQLEKPYDIVVASYVLHGLQKEQRLELYSAMKRLAKKRIIIMDYNQRRGILTSFVEWLERGDYFNFIQLAEAEMQESFPHVHVIQTGKRAAWYVCECDHSNEL